jgi:hypothetical protein
MTRIRLKYVNEYRDRHGRVRRYFRRRRGRSIPLPGLPGSIEFMAAYQAALAVVLPPPPSPKHVIGGSLAAVAAGYLRSADFANLSSSSQRSYRTALKPILAAHGHRLMRDLTKVAARHVIEEIGATRPGMANLTRAVLSKIAAYSIETGVRADNPFAGLKPYRLGTYHTWTDAEIEQFERRWPLGTRERLAFALLLHTAQRGGDVVKMLRSDIVDGRIRVAQDKTRKGTTNELMIPIHPALARALQAGPIVGMQHHNGRARQAASTAHETNRGGRQACRASRAMRGARSAQGCPSSAGRERRNNKGDRRGERPSVVGRDRTLYGASGSSRSCSLGDRKAAR